MIVVPYADFFSNPALYRETAENYGIKILPKKQAKKLSRRKQRKLDALYAVIGILPSDINETAEKDARLAQQ